MILDRPRLIVEILRDALALYRRDWRTYLLVCAVVIIPAEVLVTGLGLGQLSGPYATTSTPGETLVPLALQQFVTIPLSTAMAIAVVVGRLRDEPVPAGRAIQAGLDLFAPLLLVVVLILLATVAGLVAFIVGAIFVAVRLIVAVPAVVIEGHRGLGALERSWRLVQGSWWRSLGTVLTVNVVGAIAAAIVFVVPASALAESADSEAIAFAGAVLGQVVTVPLTAIAITLLFGDLRARASAEGRDTPVAA